MSPQMVIMETTMVLRVDLECYRCYTKVKRTLCSIPQIRDQIYNEKQNTVTIRVVCCSPDKIRDKLLSKAGKAIKDILMIAESPRPEKPGSNPEKPPSKPEKPPSKPEPREGPPATAQANEKPAAEKITKKVTFEPQGDEPVSTEGPKKQEAAAAMVYMQPPQVVQHYPGYPVNAGCLACYEGRMCYHCHGVPGGLGGYYGVPPPPPPGGYGYGYGYRPYSDYISDENATGCVVM